MEDRLVAYDPGYTRRISALGAHSGGGGRDALAQRRFSWQLPDEPCFPQAHDANEFIIRNAVSLFDVAVALLRHEWSKFRRSLPQRLDWREIAVRIRHQLPSCEDLARLINKFSYRCAPQALHGRDALFATEMAQFEHEQLPDLDDDSDDAMSSVNSTVCTVASDKRMAEMEAQLAELRSIVATLQNQKKNPDPPLSPPPDPAKSSGRAGTLGAVPPISKTAPLPPPPPPPSFLLSSRNSTTADSGTETDPFSATAALKSAKTPVPRATAGAADSSDDEKENAAVASAAPPSRRKPRDQGDTLMSALAEALAKRRKQMGSGSYTRAIDELEKPKSRDDNPAIRSLCAAIPPPSLNASRDSEWSEDNEEEWN